MEIDVEKLLSDGGWRRGLFIYGDGRKCVLGQKERDQMTAWQGICKEHCKVDPAVDMPSQAHSAFKHSKPSS